MPRRIGVRTASGSSFRQRATAGSATRSTSWAPTGPIRNWSRPARASPHARTSCLTTSTSSTPRRTKPDAACPARPDHSKGYVWAVHPGYDIYLATDDGKIVKKLTDAPGYDAEGTVNWKDKKIVYTSLASGDLDLWSMKLDGSGKKRLTTTLGYDGGSVLSRDGKKLVWRAHHPADGEAIGTIQGTARRQPDRADEDGALRVQLPTAPMPNRSPTSAAPASRRTFTPDGKQIIFASNKNECDSREVRTVPDGSRRRQPRAGDVVRRLHLVSRVLARTAATWSSPRAGRPRRNTNSTSSWPGGATSRSGGAGVE